MAIVRIVMKKKVRLRGEGRRWMKCGGGGGGGGCVETRERFPAWFSTVYDSDK